MVAFPAPENAMTVQKPASALPLTSIHPSAAEDGCSGVFTSTVARTLTTHALSWHDAVAFVQQRDDLLAAVTPLEVRRCKLEHIRLTLG